MRRRVLRSSLSRTGERLDGHHLPLGIVILAAGAVIAVLSVMSINGLPFTHPYRVDAIVPATAPIVRPGDEVRVAGQRVGQVRDVAPAANGRRVTMEIDNGEVGRDATASVRLRGLAGAVYIDLTRGDAADPAPSGWAIPRSRTSTGTQLTDVVAAFDRQTRRGLERTLTAYGGGIAGRGRQLNQGLADLPPALEEGAPLLRALTPRPGALAGVVNGLDHTAVGLAGDAPGALGQVITSANAAVGAVGAERPALGSAIEQTPPTFAGIHRTLPLASPLLDDLTTTSRALSPVVAKLGRTLPDINRLLSRERNVAELSKLARAANPVLAAAGPVIHGFAPSAETLAPLARSAEPLAAYVARYPHDVFAGPHGFTTWGRFFYDQGQAKGHRAVRFTPVFTCSPGRDPYPAPGQASTDRMPCFK